MLGAAKTGEQGGKGGPVLFIESDKLHAKAVTSLTMTNDGVCKNLPLLNKKMQASENAFDFALTGFQKEAAHAHVADTGEVLATVALPKHPDVAGRFYAGGQSPGGGAYRPREGVTGHHGLASQSPCTR